MKRTHLLEEHRLERRQHAVLLLLHRNFAPRRVHCVGGVAGVLVEVGVVQGRVDVDDDPGGLGAVDSLQIRRQPVVLQGTRLVRHVRVEEDDVRQAGVVGEVAITIVVIS